MQLKRRGGHKEIVMPEGWDDAEEVTFECEPMSPVDWATLIDSIMRKVHRLPADYRGRGWVSQAE